MSPKAEGQLLAALSLTVVHAPDVALGVARPRLDDHGDAQELHAPHGLLDHLEAGRRGVLVIRDVVDEKARDGVAEVRVQLGVQDELVPADVDQVGGGVGVRRVLAAQAQERDRLVEDDPSPELLVGHLQRVGRLNEVRGVHDARDQAVPEGGVEVVHDDLVVQAGRCRDRLEQCVCHARPLVRGVGFLRDLSFILYTHIMCQYLKIIRYST